MSTPPVVVLKATSQFFLDGPRAVLPRNISNDGAWFDLEMRLGKHVMGRRSVLETRSLYLPAQHMRDGSVAGIVRRAVWLGGRDLERARKGTLESATIIIQQFMIGGQARDSLLRLACTTERVTGHLAATWAEKQEPQALTPASMNPTYLQFFKVGDRYRHDVGWLRSPQDSQLNQAWLKTWRSFRRAMQTPCSMTERYDVPPFGQYYDLENLSDARHFYKHYREED